MLGGFLGQLFGGGGGSAAGIRATVGADITEYEAKMRQADQTMKRTASSMSSELDKGARAVSSGLGGIGGMLGVGGALVLAGQIGSAASELNTLGAQSERLSTAFVRQWGDQAPAAMERLRTASQGTMNDMDLMLAANQAKMLGVTASVDELGKLMLVAQDRGRAMGLTTAEAYSAIIRGIGRLSPQILDDIAVTVDAENTYKTYAASIGKAAAELTDYEKRAALVAKVTADVGAVTLDAAGKQEALQAAKANLRGELGRLISDFITETGVVEKATDSLNTFTETVNRTNDMNARVRESTAEYVETMNRAHQSYGMGSDFLDRYQGMLQNLTRQYKNGEISLGTYQAKLGEWTEGMANAYGMMTKADIAAADLQETLVRNTAAAFNAAKGFDAAGNAASRMGAQIAAAAKVQYSPYGYQIYGSAQGSYEAVQSRVEYLQAENERRVIARQMEAGREEQLESQRSAAAKSVDIAQQQFDAIRGIVQSALSPTAVTAADLAATAAGTYVDKWDEYMRRVRMPESGMDAAQIAEQERLFYSGQMMDQINWDAVVGDVQRKVQEEAGREAMIQEAMRQVQMAGIGATQAQVAGALGITDYKALGVEQGQMLASGMRAEGLAVKFTEEYETEWVAQEERWVSMGKMSVVWLADGMEAGATPDVTHRLVNVLVPRLAEVLTGGARP